MVFKIALLGLILFLLISPCFKFSNKFIFFCLHLKVLGSSLSADLLHLEPQPISNLTFCVQALI